MPQPGEEQASKFECKNYALQRRVQCKTLLEALGFSTRSKEINMNKVQGMLGNLQPSGFSEPNHQKTTTLCIKLALRKFQEHK
jgi:hypothetical protein